MGGIFDSGLFKGAADRVQDWASRQSSPSQSPPSGLTGLDMAREKASDSALEHGQPFQEGWSPGSPATGAPSMRDVLGMQPGDLMNRFQQNNNVPEYLRNAFGTLAQGGTPDWRQMYNQYSSQLPDWANQMAQHFGRRWG